MPQQASMLEHWLQPFIIDTDKLCALTHQLSSTYTHLALHSDEQFLATPVTRLPTGEEKGEYLAIDLGGSNLRVAFVTLRGAGSHHQKTRHIEAELGVDGVIQKKYEKSWPIDAHLKADKPEHLFAWLGDCLAEVINDRLQAGDAAFTEIPLGIAFSFPMMYVLYIISLHPQLVSTQLVSFLPNTGCLALLGSIFPTRSSLLSNNF